MWFNGQGEEAAKFYTSIFPNSEMGRVSLYLEEGKKIHGQKPGTVMTVEFSLNGCKYLALNGGPNFKFSEATSQIVNCETQKEIDHFWENLSAGGDPKAQQCGWLKDKYGLSWQIVPTMMADIFTTKDTEKSNRVMKAMLNMKKLDIETLKKAGAGTQH